MRKFLKRVFIFTILTISIISLSAILYYNIKDKYFINNNLQLKSGVTTLIIGDSHAETTFDDSIIPHSQNIAFHAEHFLFTYFKLKKVLEANPQIKKIIISYGPHNISKGADVTLFSMDRTSRSFARYFMLLNREAVWDIYSPSQNWRINYLKWKYYIPFQLKLEAKLISKLVQGKFIKLKDFPFIGKFYASSKHVFADVNTPIQGHYYNKGELLKKSDLAIKYLYKIADLCEENNVKIILINTPVHKKYHELIPKYFSDYYTVLTSKIINKYNNIEFIDYSQYHLPDEYFGDYHHVNVKGAEVISRKL
jgi:hypothetical protein